VIQVAAGTRVYLACRPVSMRYGFDGLAAQVAPILGADPFSGHVFIFRGKRAGYLKILYYDGTGALRRTRPALCAARGLRAPGSCHSSTRRIKSRPDSR
jgi:transposase